MTDGFVARRTQSVCEELKAYVQNGRIVFSVDGQPLALKDLRIGQSTIDLHLGHNFHRPKDLGDLKVAVKERVELPEECWESVEVGTGSPGVPATYELGPGEFVLAETLEHFRVPVHLMAAVEGRSGYARLGMSVHQSAPWLHPGWSKKIALEIYNSGRWTLELIPRETRPCQVAFMQLSSPVPLPYDDDPASRFAAQTSAIPPKTKSN